jgi:hypothetical protein
LLVLTLPVIVREFAYFIESFPLYVRRLHALATDSKPALGAQNSSARLARLSGRSAIYDVGERLVRYFPALGMVGWTSFHRDRSIPHA